VYAGAMLPKAYVPLDAIFKSIYNNPEVFKEIEFHFIGTGRRPNDDQSYTIRPLAEKYHLWQTNVYEYPKRIPYLDVLVHLKAGDGIFILGSTEPHYTPSKTYQAALSGKPILAVLHSQSTAVKVVRESGAGMVLDFEGEKNLKMEVASFPSVFEKYKKWIKTYSVDQISMGIFDNYSAKKVTEKVVKLLN